MRNKTCISVVPMMQVCVTRCQSQQQCHFFVNEHDVRSVLHWQVSFEHLHKSKDLFKA